MDARWNSTASVPARQNGIELRRNWEPYDYLALIRSDRGEGKGMAACFSELREARKPVIASSRDRGGARKYVTGCFKWLAQAFPRGPNHLYTMIREQSPTRAVKTCAHCHRPKR